MSDSTADEDRKEKVHIYLQDMAVQAYFIHQPEMKKPAEFRGWRREPSGTIVEIPPDPRGALFSESLNLSFRWTDQHHSHVRLLRPYLPDGTPITTAIEERNLHAEAKKRIEAERDLRAEAEARAAEEADRRQALEREVEQLRRQLANR